MGHKIFVSYKYADADVKNLTWWGNSTVRDYVTEFQNKLSDEDDINKGEEDDEDLSGLSEEVIWEKLKNRIYDSSVTVVFISSGVYRVKLTETSGFHGKSRIPLKKFREKQKQVKVLPVEAMPWLQ